MLVKDFLICTFSVLICYDTISQEHIDFFLPIGPPVRCLNIFIFVLVRKPNQVCSLTHTFVTIAFFSGSLTGRDISFMLEKFMMMLELSSMAVFMSAVVVA
eukprot:TRINITY_DN11798_c0_g1_i1.p1 TRINITY_DN11798_c0_g1~~TRINITY_DN11798_c0_g1_i1.p1  ORF type:complete len:101 (+),score=19.92 TRINITY_DN11798_c0_g1_i1:221-523(+)